jgi:hypothetical protein
MSRILTLVAVAAAVAAVVPAVAQGAIPAARLTLSPGQQDQKVVYDSSGTEIFNNYNDAPDKHGLIRWESGGKYASTHETFMVLGFRLVQGAPHRMFDGHQTPADSPWGWSPPAYPGDGPCVCPSPFAIDYQGDSRGLQYVAEANNYPSGTYHWQILSQSEMEARRGQWAWLWVDIVWGRRDDSSGPPGSVKIWVAGEDTPRVNVSNINTRWVEEGMITFWSSQYWSNGAPAAEITDVAAPRFGRTPQQAYEDNPVFYATWGGDGGVGGGLYAPLAPVDGNVPVPAPLRWSSSPAPPPPPPQCSNGQDDDGDGKVDLADPGCANASDTSESPDPPQCSNGQDDDGDGKVDLADPGCANASDTSESPDPPPPPPPGAPSFTSNIADGATVQQGTTWNVTVSPTAERVELWADDRRLADCQATSCSTTIDAARFSAGPHILGIAYTINGVRSAFTGGISARITVVP